MQTKLITAGIVGSVLLFGGASGAFSQSEISQSKIEEKFNKSQIKDKYVLEESKLVKREVKNPTKDKYKGEPKDEVKVTIGDNTPVKVGIFGATTEFQPDIEIGRWNEVYFRLKTSNLLSDVATSDKSVSFVGDRINFETPKMDFEMYGFSEKEGGYKYVWYLNKKPASNKIVFEFESSGLDFFYQPPLNEDYPLSKNCSPTECDSDNDGDIDSFRPIDVVGSYVAYHSTRGGINDANGKDYGTGQAFIIYRPHLIDANGMEAWGNLTIENGLYTVEIPREFFDKATFPIKSNDTFGYTTAGASSVTLNNANPARGNSYATDTYTASTGDTITKMSIYCSRTSTGVLSLANYTYVSGLPASRLGSEEVITPGSSAGWADSAAVSNSLTNGTAYTLALGHVVGADVTVYYTAVTNARSGHNSGNLDATWVHLSYGAIRFSMYTTYTTSGGSPTVDDTQIRISDE